jgi:uncharacterized cupin superfamily protein
MPNIYDPVFDEPRTSLDGFHAQRARLGHQLGTERVGLSLWEVPAGQAVYPYHFHLAEEEVLVVLEGRPLLRSPEGWRRLDRGEVVRFPVGEDGAHQLVNDTGETLRLLSISTHGQPDVVIYPDEGKLCAAERTPDGSGLKTFFRLADRVPYDEGIQRPEIGHVDPA